MDEVNGERHLAYTLLYLLLKDHAHSFTPAEYQEAWRKAAGGINVSVDNDLTRDTVIVRLDGHNRLRREMNPIMGLRHDNVYFDEHTPIKMPTEPPPSEEAIRIAKQLGIKL